MIIQLFDALYTAEKANCQLTNQFYLVIETSCKKLSYVQVTQEYHIVILILEYPEHHASDIHSAWESTRHIVNISSEIVSDIRKFRRSKPWLDDYSR